MFEEIIKEAEKRMYYSASKNKILLSRLKEREKEVGEACYLMKLMGYARKEPFELKNAREDAFSFAERVTNPFHSTTSVVLEISPAIVFEDGKLMIKTSQNTAFEQEQMEQFLKKWESFTKVLLETATKDLGGVMKNVRTISV
ncbi:hypothetical protein [Eubacterium oxidoreducens]|uniref:Uncharacterized protein n=1 Tax=Eubacterium oxidoreducens TaxID=1732 RepID=A0A1G6C3P5_EUBOX|nr:hypothetical protein [Eubacterium oxidoreducens]SDB27438.1 hypothetical protein SAMN02910417_02022 [Eubacterium oxidoreducens]